MHPTEDIIESYYQENWTLTAPMFGRQDQLKVLGFNGKFQKEKLYFVKCSVCSLDPELYGDGVFTTTKANLVAGKEPCGCSPSPKRTEKQLSTVLERILSMKGYKFTGFSGDYKSKSTRCGVYCETHGQNYNNTASMIISLGTACRFCGYEGAKGPRVSDSDVISSFLKTGSFPYSTCFTRSSESTSNWIVSCGLCGEVNKSFVSDLRNGCIPCSCGINRQREAYINKIYCPDTEEDIAIKFGIARDSSSRLYRQKLGTPKFIVENYGVWEFPDVSSCRTAERLCLDSLVCGVLTKQEYEDGYTETTSITNLPTIVEIFEQFGGQLKEKLNES